MKKIALVEINEFDLAFLSGICGKWEFSCGQCGAKMYDLDVLWSGIEHALSQLPTDSDEADALLVISYEIVDPLCDSLEICDLTGEQLNKYEVQTGYPREYLRGEKDVYMFDGFYRIKKYEKVYLTFNKSCPCVDIVVQDR